MPAAVLTPRVRMMAICDDVRESKLEAAVFHLKGVRQRISAPAFPFVAERLWLFFVLSSPRPGMFPGYVRVVNDRTDRIAYYSHLRPQPTFKREGEICTGRVSLQCRFPEAGPYTIQVWFFRKEGLDVLKGEMPFSITSQGSEP